MPLLATALSVTCTQTFEAVVAHIRNLAARRVQRMRGPCWNATQKLGFEFPLFLRNRALNPILEPRVPETRFLHFFQTFTSSRIFLSCIWSPRLQLWHDADSHMHKCVGSMFCAKGLRCCCVVGSGVGPRIFAVAFSLFVRIAERRQHTTMLQNRRF